MKRNRNPTNKPVMKRYATLDSLFGSRSFSYRPSIVLLSSFYRSSIVKRKQYGNDTETIRKRYGIERRMSERRTNEEQRNKGG